MRGELVAQTDNVAWQVLINLNRGSRTGPVAARTLLRRWRAAMPPRVESSQL